MELNSDRILRRLAEKEEQKETRLNGQEVTTLFYGED